MPWTVEQVLALAPDAPAAKAGRDLSSSHKWKSSGRNQAALWGECKGSAAEPYKTVVDLAEPAFKCTCPSRKFPCKHALGLFLIYAAQPATIPTGEIPAWAQEWLGKREQKAKGKQPQGPNSREDEARLAQDQQKRAAKRAARIEHGVEELRLWLADLVREGFRELPSRPRQFWEQPAARMIDAQAPGLARQLQYMATIPYSGPGWPDRLLSRVGRLHLLLEGFRRIEWLPDELTQEVRSHLGFTQTTDEVLATGEHVSDTWSVLGRRVVTEERLVTQRTWLCGDQTGRHALVLDFAQALGASRATGLDLSLLPGTAFSGTLAFFPGALRLRAVLAERRAPEPIPALPGDERIEAALGRAAASLSRDPWVGRVPMGLRAVRPVHRAEEWFVVDGDGMALPVLATSGWKLLAISGGHPVACFGEWSWDSLDLLSAIGSDGFTTLGQTMP